MKYKCLLFWNAGTFFLRCVTHIDFFSGTWHLENCKTRPVLSRRPTWSHYPTQYIIFHTNLHNLNPEPMQDSAVKHNFKWCLWPHKNKYFNGTSDISSRVCKVKTGFFNGDIGTASAAFVVTKTDKTSCFPKPNQVLFVSNTNQNTVLWLEKTMKIELK